MDKHIILTPVQPRIACTIEGPSGAPVVMFSNALGATMSMWELQATALSRRFRVLRYDTRGHGASESHCGPALTLDDLGNDVLRVMDALDVSRVNFCGISMGGLIGLWLAVYAPQRVQGLVIANSAPKIGSAIGWQERAAQVRAAGMHAVAEEAAKHWFTPSFREQSPHVVGELVQGLFDCPPNSYAACCDALAHADLRGELYAIDAPTLILAGRHDLVTTIDDARAMEIVIPEARYAELEASHLSSVEAAEEFSRYLRAFLE